MRLRNPLLSREGQIGAAIAGVGITTWSFWLLDSPLGLFVAMFALWGALIAILAVVARGRGFDDDAPAPALDDDDAPDVGDDSPTSVL